MDPLSLFSKETWVLIMSQLNDPDLISRLHEAYPNLTNVIEEGNLRRTQQVLPLPLQPVSSINHVEVEAVYFDFPEPEPKNDSSSTAFNTTTTVPTTVTKIFTNPTDITTFLHLEFFRRPSKNLCLFFKAEDGLRQESFNNFCSEALKLLRKFGEHVITFGIHHHPSQTLSDYFRTLLDCLNLLPNLIDLTLMGSSDKDFPSCLDFQIQKETLNDLIHRHHRRPLVSPQKLDGLHFLNFKKAAYQFLTNFFLDSISSCHRIQTLSIQSWYWLIKEQTFNFQNLSQLTVECTWSKEKDEADLEYLLQSLNAPKVEKFRLILKKHPKLSAGLIEDYLLRCLKWFPQMQELVLDCRDSYVREGYVPFLEKGAVVKVKSLKVISGNDLMEYSFLESFANLEELSIVIGREVKSMCGRRGMKQGRIKLCEAIKKRNLYESEGIWEVLPKLMVIKVEWEEGLAYPWIGWAGQKASFSRAGYEEYLQSKDDDGGK